MRSFVIPLVLFWLGLVSAVNLPYRGADFSSLPLVEATNKYTESSNANPQPFERILANHGVNLARIRLWTGEQYNLTYALNLAQRAKAVGMAILLDLHYSDNWADPGKQVIPSGWPTDLEDLVSHIYSYTHDVMTTFNAHGIPVPFIQVGNEISDGLLWPAGQVSKNPIGASRLLHAGARAVRDASPSTKISIHLANGWDTASATWFYDQVFQAGEKNNGLTLSDFDIFAFTLYPFFGSGATINNLQNTFQYVVSKYKKDIMVVETTFPAVCDAKAHMFAEAIDFGIDGQISWIEGVSAALNAFGDRALGLVVWEPGWLGNANLGSVCDDNLMVDSKGVIRKSLDVLRYKELRCEL